MLAPFPASSSSTTWKDVWALLPHFHISCVCSSYDRDRKTAGPCKNPYWLDLVITVRAASPWPVDPETAKAPGAWPTSTAFVGLSSLGLTKSPPSRNNSRHSQVSNTNRMGKQWTDHLGDHSYDYIKDRVKINTFTVDNARICLLNVKLFLKEECCCHEKLYFWYINFAWSATTTV